MVLRPFVQKTATSISKVWYTKVEICKMELFAESALSTRELIIEQMYRLMCQEGYRKICMEDVAAAAKVSRATIYAHFKDKEDLFIATARQLSASDQEALKEIVASKGPVTNRVAKFLRTKVTKKQDRCREAKSSLDDLFEMARPRLLMLRSEMIKVEAGLLAEILIQGKLEGVFKFENAFTTAESMLMAMHCFMPYSLTADEFGDEDSLHTKMDAMITLLLASLGVVGFDASRTKYKKDKKLHSWHQQS